MIGQEIGPYKIIEKIGQGARGTVYKGLHLRLEKEVAIKVLASEYACDPSIRQRFIAEAKIQAQLTHPHVVNVLSYLAEGHDVLLVMEYVEGETLEQRLARLGCLPQEEAALIGRDVLAALDFMHSKAIIHRDIKPSNIMFTAMGVVKVADFGIAKVTSDSMLKRTGMYLDTLCYMSPEEIQGKPVSVASDVYALGVTLYRTVTGRLPFPSDSEYTIVKGHIEQAPAPPWVLNDHVSQTLGQIILHALEKMPERRYCGAQDFAQALTAFMQKPDDVPRSPSGIRRSRRKRRAFWPSVALVTGVGLALGLFGYSMLFQPLRPSVATMPVPDVPHLPSLVPVPEQTSEATENPGALPAVPIEPNVDLAPPSRLSQPLAPDSRNVQEQSSAQKETATVVPLRAQPLDTITPIPDPREEYRRSRKERASRAEETTVILSKPKSRGKPNASVIKENHTGIKENHTGWRIEKSDRQIVR